MANPIYQPSVSPTTGAPLIHGSNQKSPVDPSGPWRTVDVEILLRAIYFELRIQTQLLADGLGVNAQLASYRADASAMYPNASDQD